MRIYTLILFFVGLFFKLPAKEIVFKFYSDEIHMGYEEEFFVRHSVKLNDKSIIAFYKKLDKTNYQKLLDELNKHKVNYGLNDWFYYKLLRTLSQELFKTKSKNYQIAFCWFLLNKSGYNANIRFVKGKYLDLYIYSQSSVLNTSFNFNKQHYILLEHNHTLPEREMRVDHLHFIPNPEGNLFSFELNRYPKLNSPEIIERKISYKSHGKSEILNIKINKSIIDMMKDYPHLPSEAYFKVGLSEESRTVIKPLINGRIGNMSDSAIVRYLLTFVRMGFKYEDDEVSFGKEKYMTAEEVLYYPTADCEDKSALFFHLVKEFLDINILVLLYPNHINIAVLLDQAYGKPFKYQGNQYSVCETNVLGDSEKAGIGYSTMYEKYPNPKVIYEYHPNEK